MVCSNSRVLIDDFDGMNIFDGTNIFWFPIPSTMSSNLNSSSALLN